MKSAAVTWLTIITLITLGCGYGSMHNYGTTTTTSVQMTQISPNTANAGGPAFMLTVDGSGFGSNSVVYWNSMPLATKFLTANQLVATVLASDVATPEAVQVYVSSGGTTSNTMNFTIN